MHPARAVQDDGWPGEDQQVLAVPAQVPDATTPEIEEVLAEVASVTGLRQVQSARVFGIFGDRERHEDRKAAKDGAAQPNQDTTVAGNGKPLKVQAVVLRW